jgi:2-dehydro-3-deoxygluconokinase
MFDVICVGESMALITPDPPGRLAAGGPAHLDVAGAESTVACYLAQLGIRVAWASRVGADPLGTLLRDRIAAFGVDVSLVDTDPGARTGVFFKDPAPDGTAVYYYRDGSAAAGLDATLLARPELAGCRLVHLSGITPALSASCADLVRQAVARLPVSFDVNHRPALWPAEQAAPVLLDLARRAEIVFVGLDEAERLWGTRTALDVRDLVGEGTLVVKDGPIGATSFGRDGTTFVPAPPVEVVEPVGAGDAFAAGYLCGRLRGRPESERLLLGHRVAGAALRVTGDVAQLSFGGPA